MSYSVKCICIDEKNKPEEIPINKWLIEKKEYTIYYTCLCMPQKIIGCYLEEIELDESNIPYEYFALSRFAFTDENLKKLKELIDNCTDSDIDINEILKQTELIENFL